MKDSLATAISDITQMLKSQDTAQQSPDKFRELLDTLYSYYMGLEDNKSFENCITGDKDYFINHLSLACERATSIDIISAFIMESGVRLIIDDLKKAADRGVKIRILQKSTTRFLKKSWQKAQPRNGIQRAFT